MKNVVIIISSIALFCLLFMLGCRTLISTIANSNDCEQFNIDNVEVHTGIDIPAITSSTCVYDEGVKNASFILDTTKGKIKEYLVRNKFEKKDNLYLARGETKKSKWHAQFNIATATLDMRIEYKKTD